MDIPLSSFIKLKWNQNGFTKRNETELTIDDCNQSLILQNPFILLMNQYNVTPCSIKTIMYGNDGTNKDDNELFIVTSNMFIGITLGQSPIFCKYIRIRDEIRKKSILNMLQGYFDFKQCTFLKDKLNSIQEIQYRINDKNYEWNTYLVLKHGILFDDSIIETIISIVQSMNYEWVEFKRFMMIHCDNYKLSMIGFSKMYNETRVQLKLFLSKVKV